MQTTTTKEAVRSENVFLDEALALAREAVALRDRLNRVQHEHHALLSQREEAAYEGRDVFPTIRALFLEIEELPAKIAQLEERARWTIEQGVKKLNERNSHRAGQEYIKIRDDLRQQVEHFRDAWGVIQEEVKKRAALVGPLTEPFNVKLEEIQHVLGGGPLPRVSYQPLTLPPLDADLVRRGQLVAALDRWSLGLR